MLEDMPTIPVPPFAVPPVPDTWPPSETPKPARRRHPSLSYLSQAARAGPPPRFSPSLSLNKYSERQRRAPEPAKSPAPARPFSRYATRPSPPFPIIPAIPSAPPRATQLASPATSPPPTGSSRGARRHGEVHAQEQGLGGGGRHGGRRRAARRPHPLPHPRRAAAARPLAVPLAAPQGPGGGRPRGRRLPRAQEQAAREAAAARAQGEGGRHRRRRRRREEVRAGVVVRGRGVRGRHRGLLRRQRVGLGRRREEHEGDDALQPDLQLGDDEHPRLRDQGQQQPVPPQAADAGLPLRPELARDGRVLRRRRATATPDLQGQVQLLPRERVPAPRTVRVDGARLLGLFPRATTTRSSSIDLCNTRMTSSSMSCRGRDAKCSSVRFLIHLLL